MDYETVKHYYESGRWNAMAVKLAAKKGVITKAECEEILAGAEEKDGLQGKP